MSRFEQAMTWLGQVFEKAPEDLTNTGISTFVPLGLILQEKGYSCSLAKVKLEPISSMSVSTSKSRQVILFQVEGVLVDYHLQTEPKDIIRTLTGSGTVRHKLGRFWELLSFETFERPEEVQQTNDALYAWVQQYEMEQTVPRASKALKGARL